MSELDQAVARVRDCLATYHAAQKAANDAWNVHRDAQEAEGKAAGALMAARLALKELVEGRISEDQA